MPKDALTDRDLVHRQTASVIVKHIVLGVAGMGCEDSDASDESCLAKLFRNVPACQDVLSVLAVLEDVRLGTGCKVLGSWPKLTPRICRKTATTTSTCGMTTTLPLRVSNVP